MQPEDLIISARPRREEESLALGLEFARRHSGPLFAIWLGSFGILCLLLAPLLWVETTGILYGLLLWWLAPVCERFLLFWLSRKAFAVHLRLGDLRKQWRAILLPGLWQQLFLRRISLLRGMYIPLWVLERCPHAELSRRVRSLQSGTAELFVIIFWHIEGIVSIGVLCILLLLLPTGPADISDIITKIFVNGRLDTVDMVLCSLAWPLAVLITRPFFIAVNFCIYLNGRIVDEAWDLRLGFTAIAQRLERGTRAAAPLLLFAAIALLSLFSPSLQAQTLEPAVPAAASEAAASEPAASEAATQTQSLRTILADPQTFGVPPDPDEPPDFSDFKIPDWITTFFLWIGACLIIALVAWLLYLLVKAFLNRGVTATAIATSSAPEFIGVHRDEGHDILHDYLSRAQEHFDRGELRQCLACLYQGNIDFLVRRHELHIPDSATEGDCLRLARPRLQSAPLAQFEALSATWIRTAYAHEIPAARTVREHLELFRSAWRLQDADKGATKP